MSQHTTRLPYHQLSSKAFMGLVNLSETVKKGPLGRDHHRHAPQRCE